jgi:transcriptional regulator with XRE-family HTH domain
MSSDPQFPQLRARAIELRRAGKSRREIKAILGIASNQTLGDALRGEPPPEWTRRPNAKDGVHAQARELREQGLDYEEIAARLGVSKSSVSLWVRDLPTPARLSYEECRKRSVDGTRRYWEAERPVREAARTAVRDAAAAEIGPLTEREIIIAGAIAYWCEGAKSKPYRRAEMVNFINSDASVIRLFLAFLRLADVAPQRLRCIVHIHETGDIEAATHYWQKVTGAAPDQFMQPNIKRHRPRTNRRNTGADYHGCLQIRVTGSRDLYLKIEGWASALMTAARGCDEEPSYRGTGASADQEEPGPAPVS